MTRSIHTSGLCLLCCLVGLGCEPVEEVCLPYTGSNDHADACDPELCVPANFDVVAPSTDEPLTARASSRVEGQEDEPLTVRVHGDLSRTGPMEPRLDFIFGAEVLADDSAASLNTHLQELSVQVPVGRYDGLDPTNWIVVSNDAQVDALTKVGDEVRVRGSYVGDFTSYRSVAPCGVDPFCAPRCDYRGESTAITFDVTFTWPR